MKRQNLFWSIFLYSIILTGQQLPQRNALSSIDFIWNPAMTSFDDISSISIAHQQQWVGFDHAPTTSLVGFQLSIQEEKMSAGGALLKDKFGLINAYRFVGTYSYKLLPQLALGLSLDVGQYQFQGDRIISSSFNDPLLFNEQQNNSQYNVGLGIFYTTLANSYSNKNHFFFGLSFNQLLPNDLTFTNSSITNKICLLYTSPSPRDRTRSRMPSSA